MDIRNIVSNPILMDLSEIKQDPGPYTISFGFDLDPLTQSIKDFGLMNPLYVTKSREGGMDVVSGYRRIKALKSIGWEKVPVFDLSSSEMSSRNLFLLNFHENLATRPFNQVEKGMILRRLTLYFNRQEIHELYLSPLGISSIKEMDFLLRLEESSIEMKEAIVQDRISFRTAKLLSELDDESCAEILNWISNLNLNTNKQIQLIEYMRDISTIEQTSIVNILMDEPFIKILKNTSRNNPQKAKDLFKLLRTRQYPFLSQAEKTYKKMVAEFNLPKRVRIIHPPYFEASDYKMEILFRDGEELRASIEELVKIRNLKGFTNPWDKDA